MHIARIKIIVDNIDMGNNVKDSIFWLYPKEVVVFLNGEHLHNVQHILLIKNI